jgi:hypothetical protein
VEVGTERSRGLHQLACKPPVPACSGRHDPMIRRSPDLRNYSVIALRALRGGICPSLSNCITRVVPTGHSRPR